MKRIIITFFTTCLLLLGISINAQASSGEYYILTENAEKLVSFMQESDIHISNYYEDFSTVQATLTEMELKLLQKYDSKAIFQTEKKYEISSDKVVNSIATVLAAPTNTTPYTGKGVKVGVLDTGVDTEHRDIKLAGGYCSLAPQCSNGVAYDDNNGHGTHVAGIIAAQKNGTGIIGIAPNVELYSIKALNDLGVGTTGSLIEGIQWAIDHDIDILNLSITTTTNDVILENSLKTAYAKGILLVGAAGNMGTEKDPSVTYPAKLNTVIAVGAVIDSLAKLPESSIGAEVEIAAPGKNIFSTYPSEWDFEDEKQDGYATLSGTSMAAPHVTGVFALYKERFPEMNHKELRALVNGLAKDLGDVGRDTKFGFGLVQYVKTIEGTPQIAKTVERGKVKLRFTNSANITSVSVNDELIKQIDGVWTFYGVQGKYPVNISYQTSAGLKIKELLNVNITTPTFTDVQPTQSFSKYIGYLSNKQQISGYNDGSFRPYQEITRAEAVVLLGRALSLDEMQQDTPFSDVPKSSFASGYIQNAVNAKIITGYKDGTFKPNQKVTRAEMAILISKAFKLQSTDSTTKAFKDISPTMAAYAYIMPIIEVGVTEGYSDNTFRPYNYMTRSEFSAFLARVQQ